MEDYAVRDFTIWCSLFPVYLKKNTRAYEAAKNSVGAAKLCNDKRRGSVPPDL
jgi:hypothetical protein